VIASVVLGIAVDDTIHIFTNYLKLIRNGDSTQEAIVKLFQKSAPALIVTTLILSISFSCFLLASFVPNQNLGLLMACGLVIALITDFLLLPLLLAKFIRE
jgi:predicted RND superfamily exporter protein